MIGYPPRGHFVDRDRLLGPDDEPEYCDVCEGRIKRDDTCRCFACARCHVMGKHAGDICAACEDENGEVK